MIHLLIYSFLISLILNALIVLFHKRLSFVNDYSDGPQKFHTGFTPRVGGIAVFASFASVSAYAYFVYNQPFFLLLSVVSLPTFLGGFADDITNKTPPFIRLMLSTASAILFIWLLGGYLHRLDIPFIDTLMKSKWIAYTVTIVAIAGVSNAFNIIDGYNGLIAIVSIITYLSLGYVAFKVHDNTVFAASLVMAGSVAGFFVLNYPFGKIFLGDGGAYLIGFVIAVLSIMLINRHHQVSVWFPFLVVIYPVFEVLFSIYRRKFVMKTSPTKPDGYHLHTLIYKRVVPFVFHINCSNKLERNYATSPFLWLLCSMGAIPAVIFWNNTPILQLFTILFCIIYILIYRSIIKLKIGKLL